MNISLILIGFAQIANIVIRIAIAVLSIYGLVLFIRLAKRGIKALDIYIQKNKE